MPLLSTAVGQPAGELDIGYDTRWTMSYAAGVPDERPELYDTQAGVLVHPLFPVAVEWELVTSRRATGTGLGDDELRRGIHYAHDLVVERPLVAGERVHVAARTVGVGRRPAGAVHHLLFVATDATGAVVWRTLHTSLFLGVELEGPEVEPDCGWPSHPEAPPALAAPLSRTTHVRAVDAHVYSECARIWNPIHTDTVAARRAGLDRPILHGTATLARSVSIATELAGVPLASVRRVAGRFRAAVDLDSSFEVRVVARTADHLWFDALLPDGRAAIADGLLALT